MTLSTFYSLILILPLFQCFDIGTPVTTNSDHPDVMNLVNATIKITPHRIWFNEDVVEYTPVAIITLEHKDKLLQYLGCAYNFPTCGSIITVDIQSIGLPSGHLLGEQIELINITDRGKSKYFIRAKDHLLRLNPCDSTDRCFAPAVISNDIDTFMQTENDEEILDSIRFIPSAFDTVTERVLLKEASSIIETNPAVFEELSTLVLIKEENICPELNAEIDTIVEYILIKQASSRIDAFPSEYETVTERVLDKGAFNRHDTIRRSYSLVDKLIERCPPIVQWAKISFDSLCTSDSIWPCLTYRWDSLPAVDTIYSYAYFHDTCPADYFEVESFCVKTVEVPATYGERTYERLIKPASTQTIEIPAEYTSRTINKIINIHEIPDSCILSHYDTISYQKLLTPAWVNTVGIASEYGERSWIRLLTPNQIFIPHQSSNEFHYQKKYLKTSTKYIRNHEMVCHQMLSSDIILALSNKLKSLDYEVGASMDVKKPLFACAILDYQKDHQLPIGPLNFETLNALNIKY